jgi:hypothetical protein
LFNYVLVPPAASFVVELIEVMRIKSRILTFWTILSERTSVDSRWGEGKGGGRRVERIRDDQRQSLCCLLSPHCCAESLNLILNVHFPASSSCAGGTVRKQSGSSTSTLWSGLVPSFFFSRIFIKTKGGDLDGRIL